MTDTATTTPITPAAPSTTAQGLPARDPDIRVDLRVWRAEGCVAGIALYSDAAGSILLSDAMETTSDRRIATDHIASRVVGVLVMEAIEKLFPRNPGDANEDNSDDIADVDVVLQNVGKPNPMLLDRPTAETVAALRAAQTAASAGTSSTPTPTAPIAGA